MRIDQGATNVQNITVGSEFLCYGDYKENYIRVARFTVSQCNFIKGDMFEL